MSAEEREKVPPVDYFRPIIADGDTGHGGLTAVMKLTKMFIGNLFPMSHLPLHSFISNVYGLWLQKEELLVSTLKIKSLVPKSVATWEARC